MKSCKATSQEEMMPPNTSGFADGPVGAVPAPRCVTPQHIERDLAVAGQFICRCLQIWMYSPNRKSEKCRKNAEEQIMLTQIEGGLRYAHEMHCIVTDGDICSAHQHKSRLR